LSNQKLFNYASKVLKKIGEYSLKISDHLTYNKPKLVKRGKDRSLYYLQMGYNLWLNDTGYIDQEILKKGIFEGASTKVIKSIVKEGDVVLDVGANIGYYTLLFSKLVGKNGKVFAFEPTEHFIGVLNKNVKENNINNVEIQKIGLSNKEQELKIDIGPSSATLHSPENFDTILDNETINLTTMNDFVHRRSLEKIDFIKIDIDGHEPMFFEGAWEALEKFSPIVIFEVSHLHYLSAGVLAWEFYDKVKKKGYLFYNENDLSEIKTKESFLRKCANFDRSSNVIISKNRIDRVS